MVRSWKNEKLRKSPEFRRKTAVSAKKADFEEFMFLAEEA